MKVMISDCHLHTNFSHDSDAKPEEMIQGAIDKGLNTICITDHFDKDNTTVNLYPVIHLIL